MLWAVPVWAYRINLKKYEVNRNGEPLQTFWLFFSVFAFLIYDNVTRFQFSETSIAYEPIPTHAHHIISYRRHRRVCAFESKGNKSSLYLTRMTFPFLETIATTNALSPGVRSIECILMFIYYYYWPPIPLWKCLALIYSLQNAFIVYAAQSKQRITASKKFGHELSWWNFVNRSFLHSPFVNINKTSSSSPFTSLNFHVFRPRLTLSVVSCECNWALIRKS